MKTHILSILAAFLVMMSGKLQSQPINAFLSNTNNQSGDTIAVSITADHFNNVSGFTLTIVYTNSNLSYISYMNAHQDIAQGLFVNAFPGELSLTFLSYPPASIGSGKLLDLEFIYTGGTADIIWDTTTPGNCEFIDQNLNVIQANFYNGSVNPLQVGNTISGHILYDNNLQTPIDGALVRLVQSGTVIDQTVSEISGHFEFRYLADGNYEIEVSCYKEWGGGNSIDALFTMRHFVSIDTLQNMRLLAADVTGDGYVNTTDALLVQKRFAMMSENFPAGDWIFEPVSVDIQGSSVTQDIHGICFGDINGDYLPSVGFTCGDMLIDSRDGSLYGTVEIGNQCWMSENLNYGQFINGSIPMADNGTIEKYCYNNNVQYCNDFGGLYQWEEVMNYSQQPTGQGICPPDGGWRIPSDDDFKTMENNLGMNQSELETLGWRGNNEGDKLKTAENCYLCDGTEGSSGFQAIPGGYRDINSGFNQNGQYGLHWTSTLYDSSRAFHRMTGLMSAQIFRYRTNISNALPVRCLKDI